MSTTTRLQTDIEVSRRYGIPVTTLRTGRSRGFGPPFLKIGRMVRYRIGDVEQWLTRARVEPGSEASN